jgi:predicted Zn-dependent protease with MMP-like domain
MPAYNTRFELSVEDMELIEDALRRTKRELSDRMVEAVEDIHDFNAVPDEVDTTVRDIHDLLGRIHNQKIFYRPRNRTYISG